MKTVEIENSSHTVNQLRKHSKKLPIRLTDHGKLVAYLFPATIYDEEDIGYMTDPAFWRMIRQRRNSDAEAIPLETIKRELEKHEPSGIKNGVRHKRNGGAKHASKGS